MNRERRALAGAIVKRAVVLLSGILIPLAWTVTAHSGSMGTPDTVTGVLFRIDDFVYDSAGDNPLSHNWGTLSGLGTVGMIYDTTFDRYAMQVSSVEGSQFGVIYPDTGTAIASGRSLLTALIRNDSGFSIDATIEVTVDGNDDTLVIRVLPDSGASTLHGDTLYQYLGPSARDQAGWSVLGCPLDLFLARVDSTIVFQQINHIAVRGSASVLDLILIDMAAAQIEGYTSSSSVVQGDTLTFHIAKLPNYVYHPEVTLAIYRGVDLADGGTALYVDSGITLPPKPYTPQPWLGAHWEPSVSIAIPMNWQPGVYVARFTRSGECFLCPNISDLPPPVGYTVFVVRAAQPGTYARVLAKLPTNTWQAYNDWGGGSFYQTRWGSRKESISYDRPYRTGLRDTINQDSSGAGQYYRFAYWFDLWADSLGLLIDYCTDEDLHYSAYDELLGKYKVFVSLEHDEYWSSEMRRKVEQQFRDDTLTSHGLAFLSSNVCYWRTGMSAERLLSVSKRDDECQGGYPPPLRGDSLWTPVNPEGRLMGIQSDGSYNFLSSHTIAKNPNHWAHRGNEVSEDRPFAFAGNHPLAALRDQEWFGGVGYEVDYLGPDSTYWPQGIGLSDLVLLAQQQDSETSVECSTATTRCDTRLYEKGATKVFAAGTMHWLYALVLDTAGGTGVQYNITSRMTRNVLTNFLSDKTGVITQSETWGGTIHIYGDVVIDSGVTVTIAPGTMIHCHRGWDHAHAGLDPDRVEITVRGRLDAYGMEDSVIVFSSPEDGIGDWYGIIAEDEGNINLCWTEIRNAAIGNMPASLCLNSDLVIDTGEVLFLGAGTVVVADTVDTENQGNSESLIEIIVMGALVCEGTVEEPVLFTSDAESKPGAWYGIRILPGGSVDLGDACRIEGAFVGLTIESGADSAVVRGVSVVSPENAGFWCESSGSRFVHDTVTDVADGYGFYLSGCDPSVDSCFIEDCEAGVYAYVSSASITNTEIMGDGMYGVYVHQVCWECSEAEDTLRVEDTKINGYFTGAHIYAGPKGHCALENCELISGSSVGASDESPYGLRAGTDAWVVLRNSTVRDWDDMGYGVYSYKSDADLGIGWKSDQGYNSIHPTDTSAQAFRVRHVANSTTDTLKAEGNWWGSDSVSSYWFVGRVDRTPWLSEAPLGKIAGWSIAVNDLVLPDSPNLSQNYPNPFNPSTTVEFTLSRRGFVEIAIFNILGQRVRTLAQREYSAGKHQITWNGLDDTGRTMASGVYLYRLVTEEWQETRKMVLVK